MKSKLIILIILFCVSSCCPGGHRKAGIYLIDIKELNDVTFFDIQSVSNEYTTYLDKTVVESNRLYNTDTLGIYFQFNTLSEKIGMTKFNFSLLNSAYACSPATDMVSLKNKIDSIQITSDTTYAEIEKGNSLTHFFFYIERNTNANIQDYIASINSNEILESAQTFNFYISTHKKPGIIRNQQLFLTIYKHNGEIITGSTGRFIW